MFTVPLAFLMVLWSRPLLVHGSAQGYQQEKRLKALTGDIRWN
jgi:hypothetical protein